MGTKKITELQSYGEDPDSLIPEIRKGTAIRLTKPERALLQSIGDTPEPERYDLIAKADRSTVESLIAKGLIQVRTIPRSRAGGETITHDEAKRAVLAAMRQQARSGEVETG